MRSENMHKNILLCFQIATILGHLRRYLNQI